MPFPNEDETTLQPPEGTTLSFDDHPAANIPAPGEVTPEALRQSTPSSPFAASPVPGAAQKASTSDALSYRGITQQGIAATTSLNKKADAAARSDVAQFAPQFDEQARKAEGITAQRRDALRLETEANQEHARQELDLWKAQQHFITEQADLEKHAFAQSQVVKQQYLANYENELMTAKMLAMQTGDPYERMSGGQAFGLIAAHAVQGFLRVGGHNIDVASQTERWVNREIAKHQQKVQDARQGANDQLHLYELARQNSRDDYEARERYRGMVLEGLKAQVGAEAARFNSQIAMATAAQKAAEIDAQLLGIKSGLADKAQKMYFDAQKMRIDQAADQARNSIAWHQAKTARMAEERKKKAQDAAMKPHGNLTIPDPGATVRNADGKIVSTKNVWRINPMASEAQQNEASKLAAEEGGKYAAIKSQLAKLRELRAPAQNDYIERFGPEWVKRYDADWRTYKRQKDLIGESVVKAFTGAAAPEAQMKRLLGILADDSGFQEGTNASGIDQLESYFRDEFVNKMNSHPAVEALPEAEQTERPYANVSNDTDAAYNANVRGKPAITTPVKAAVTETVKVGHNEVDRPGYSPSFSAYMRSTGDAVGSDFRERGQRREIDGVDYLAALIAKPEIGVEQAGSVKGKPVLSAEDIRAEAYRALSDIAAGKANADGSAPDPETQRYAAWLKQNNVDAPDADPESLYRAVATREEGQPVMSPADQLTSGQYERNVKARQDKERADFLRKGITGE